MKEILSYLYSWGTKRVCFWEVSWNFLRNDHGSGTKKLWLHLGSCPSIVQVDSETSNLQVPWNQMVILLMAEIHQFTGSFIPLFIGFQHHPKVVIARFQPSTVSLFSQWKKRISGGLLSSNSNQVVLKDLNSWLVNLPPPNVPPPEIRSY